VRSEKALWRAPGEDSIGEKMRISNLRIPKRVERRKSFQKDQKPEGKVKGKKQKREGSKKGRRESCEGCVKGDKGRKMPAMTRRRRNALESMKF